jgi:hypothetical protein
MANTKISALTSATTPLAGTEVLPIVQSGVTVKVPVSDLTAGRAVAMLTANIGDASSQNGVFDAVVGSASATTGDNTGLVIVSNSTGKGWIGFNNANNASIPGQVTYNHNTNVMDFYSSGTYSFSNGNVTLSTGNLVIGTSGKGIDFSATPNTGTSELLADYEEGDWTPTDQSGAGLTFTSVTGFYTKVGRLVTCTFGLTFPATASGANLTIGGLPYTSISSGPPNVSGGSLTYTTAAVNSAGFAIGQGATTGLLFNSAGAFFANAAFSGAILRMQFTYTAA